jgi:hypothetical protein
METIENVFRFSLIVSGIPMKFGDAASSRQHLSDAFDNKDQPFMTDLNHIAFL